MGECRSVFSSAIVDISRLFLENFQDPAIVLSYLEYVINSTDDLCGLQLSACEGSIRVTGTWLAVCSVNKFLEEFLVRHKIQNGAADQTNWERKREQEAVKNDEYALDEAAAGGVEIPDETSSPCENAPAAEFAEADEVHAPCVDSTVNEMLLCLERENARLEVSQTSKCEKKHKPESPKHAEYPDFLQKYVIRMTGSRPWEFPKHIRNLCVLEKVDKCPEPVVVINLDPESSPREKNTTSATEVEKILKDVYRMQDGSRHRTRGDASSPRQGNTGSTGSLQSAEEPHPAVKQKSKLSSKQCPDSNNGPDALARSAVVSVTRNAVAAKNEVSRQKVDAQELKASSHSSTKNDYSPSKTERKGGRPQKNEGKHQQQVCQVGAKKQQILLECSDCPYRTRFSSHMREHQLRLHAAKELQCEDCGKAFGSHRDLKRHRETHVEPLNCCDVCGKAYKSLTSLETHRKTHDSDYTKPKFPCQICLKSFSTKYVLARHIKQEHLGLKKLYICPTCDKTFVRRYSYIQHASNHLRLRPYKCETCGKTFPYKRSLELHMFTHNDHKQFSCPVCSKHFRHATSLNNHVKIHTGTKDNICSFCGKGFVQRQALERHERIHRGIKPFQCLLCQREFTDSSILRRHMIRVHKKDKKKWQEDTNVHSRAGSERTKEAPEKAVGEEMKGHRNQV